MLIEKYNTAAALTALGAPAIETRLCVSVRPGSTIMRFVRDNVELDVDGNTFNPVPFAEFDPISSGDGSVADTTTIRLDGKYLLTTEDNNPTDIFRSIIAYPLRDRPIQIGLIVLNVDTKAVIGLIPQFVGFIDNAPLVRGKDSARLEINCASFRAYAQRRVARTYSDTDHRSRFPGDGACKHISDAVFRAGKYVWNRTAAGNVNQTGGAGGGGRFDNLQTFRF